LKRIFAALTVFILLITALATPASAESAASRVDLMCTVNSEGDCLVTMNVTLFLDQSFEGGRHAERVAMLAELENRW